jgi:hypothetical protein
MLEDTIAWLKIAFPGLSLFANNVCNIGNSPNIKKEEWIIPIVSVLQEQYLFP